MLKYVIRYNQSVTIQSINQSITLSVFLHQSVTSRVTQILRFCALRLWRVARFVTTRTHDSVWQGLFCSLWRNMLVFQPLCFMRGAAFWILLNGLLKSVLHWARACVALRDSLKGARSQWWAWSWWIGHIMCTWSCWLLRFMFLAMWTIWPQLVLDLYK